MPAGTPFTPRAEPARFPGLFGLPEHKGGWMLFLLIYFNSRACLQIIKALTGKLAVSLERRRVIVHISARNVGIAFFNQLFNISDYVRNGISHFWMMCSPSNAQRISVLEVFFNVFLADFQTLQTFFLSASDDFIIYICKILNIIDLITPVFHIASERVENQEWSRVANMKKVIDRWSTDVHAYFAFFNGDKLFLFSGKAVVQLHLIFTPLRKSCNGVFNP